MFWPLSVDVRKEAGQNGEAWMRPFELSDEEWELIVPHIPIATGRGGRLKEPRKMLNGMFWVLRTGTSWRELPERYGPWQTVYHWFNRWRRDGTLRPLAEALAHRLHGDGRPSLESLNTLRSVFPKHAVQHLAPDLHWFGVPAARPCLRECPGPPPPSRRPALRGSSGRRVFLTD